MTQESRPSRRDLFRIPRGRPQAPDPATGSVPQQDRESGYLEQYLARAMGCDFEFSFNLQQYPQAAAASMAAHARIAELERQMTVYSPASEISRLNQGPPETWQDVEPGLFDLLELAQRIWRDTGGAFDITAGPLWQQWGFDQRAGRLPETAELEQALQQVGGQFLELDPENCRLRRGRPGITLNLGGIGKGHALDRAAILLRSQEIGDFLIHGGQSSVLAWGQSTTDAGAAGQAPEEGWSIGLSHPTLPGHRLAELRLCNQALGTSGSGRQGFFHQGRRYGHILDPRTGWPPDHFLSTTVVAPSAAMADALATAFFVMQLDQIEAYCRSHPEVAALVVQRAASTQTHVLLTTFNLAPDRLTVYDT